MFRFSIKLSVIIILISLTFTSCEEDFDLITEYKDQTVAYAFLKHNDPWFDKNGDPDTNWIVVNKAFLGEANVEDMASVSDSVNYPDYDQIKVSLQRIESIDPGSRKIGNPIILNYTTHYKEEGIFAQDNNIVFYTTEMLMNFRQLSSDPSPKPDDNYFYKLSIKKQGKDEVYATTKMIRGIYLGVPMSNIPKYRIINMASPVPNYTFNVKFKVNSDARVYKFKIRTFYYEKRTDGNIYLDYVDYEYPVIVTKEKYPIDAQELEVSVNPLAYYSSIERQLHNTDNVEWRMAKTKNKTGLIESHTLLFTLGSQETYVYNQVTQPSNGIIQDKPTYTNITNGFGLFTSSWDYQRDQFSFTPASIDSLSSSVTTQNLKFLNNASTSLENSKIKAEDVIITQRVLDLR